MNAITKQDAASAVTIGFGNEQSFALMQRAAKLLSSSTLVPASYRAWDEKKGENPNALANCVVALNMAQRMGADPLMVMQNLYIVEGRPSWSSQWIIAAINGCGRFSPLRFELKDLGPKEVEYEVTKWVDRQRVTSKHKATVQNLECVAWAVEKETGARLDSPKVSIEMAVREGWYGKNGSKWQTMPEVMLRYRTASFFGKLYAPELLMGLQSAEELHDVYDGEENEVRRQSVPRSTGVIAESSGEVRELTAYSDEQFARNLPKWRAAIESGKATADDVIAKAGTKGTLTQAQIDAIRAPFEPQAASEVADVQPKEDAPAQRKFTAGDVAQRLASASDLDALYIAGDLIGEVEDPEERAKLSEIFDQRQFALEAE